MPSYLRSVVATMVVVAGALPADAGPRTGGDAVVSQQPASGLRTDRLSG